ncbi:Biotin operon repressor / Biotin--protein ligase [hydrothermal vent metagenome]|uniref:Biotin operon repressor / Biotin--protein ligase n=1 Tax=hydrothermal vent metagenome TaxID=652676 RepID=A0A3B1DL60_9ZZZZ
MKEDIIRYLKVNEGYISGEEFSRRLNITRAAIWKNIEELRREGYVIAATKQGYKLASVPDKLFPVEIQLGLKTKVLGKKIYYYDVIDSTMQEAFRLGLENTPEGTVVIAESQTRGKGRLGRVWNSPRGKGIYMSLILRPEFGLMDVPKVTLLSAVAVCEAIRHVTDVDVQIKWPNDLLIEGKKVAGILTELNAQMDQVQFVVVGLGVNVNAPLSVLPEHAVSLKKVIGKKILRLVLLQEILRFLEKWYEDVNQNGFKPMMQRWKELSCTLGKRVNVDGIEGEAVDIDEYGALVIRNEQQELVKRMSGDVALI